MSLNSILFGWPEGCSNAFSTGICLVEELALTFLAGGFDVGRFTLCLFWALLPGLEADILWACSALSFALKLQKKSLMTQKKLKYASPYILTGSFSSAR